MNVSDHIVHTHEQSHHRNTKKRAKHLHVRVNVVAAQRSNAPLKQIPSTPNSFAWHTMTIEGDIDSPLRMFLNWLPSDESVFRVSSGERNFFVEVPPMPVQCDRYDDYSDTLDARKDWHTLSIDWTTIAKNPIRQTLQGYEIQNTPLDDSDSDWYVSFFISIVDKSTWRIYSISLNFAIVTLCCH